jgi:quercetin dioxygenase-like cupin family protein
MAEPVFQRSGEGGALGNPLGGEVVFKVRGEQTDGSLTAFETVVAAGEGPPLHTHANEDESLFVLDGDVRFKLGNHVTVGPAGSFVFVPRGMPHTFQNVGDEPARMLIHFTPSGMERFFDRFAALEAPDAGAFKSVGAGVGMDVVGPPVAESDPVDRISP